MSKIENILKDRLDSLVESIDINDSTDWDDLEYDDLDEDSTIDSLDSSEFVSQLHNFVESGEDEIEIFYDNGDSIVLECNVVSSLLDTYSEVELIEGAENMEKLHQMIGDIFEEVIEIDEVDE